MIGCSGIERTKFRGDGSKKRCEKLKRNLRYLSKINRKYKEK
ncbi:hypothetical protein QFZ77_002442 [Paenibacillus sp. V4I3]|nr:hypothetical protein [Paenibacillus sp. V4I3]